LADGFAVMALGAGLAARARTTGRALAVTFVVVNSIAVLYSNRLPAWSADWAQYTRAHWDRPVVRGVDWVLWWFSWYPYLAGIDQKYTMFSTLKREQFIWRYYAVDRFGNRNEVAGETDHKSGKFQLNLYGDESARRRYATYLCRKSPPRGGGQWHHLDWDWWFRSYAAPAAARATGSHWAEPARFWKTEAFPCPE
jgi:hypothetical protein